MDNTDRHLQPHAERQAGGLLRTAACFCYLKRTHSSVIRFFTRRNIQEHFCMVFYQILLLLLLLLLLPHAAAITCCFILADGVAESRQSAQ
jgi:hypothetical protein